MSAKPKFRPWVELTENPVEYDEVFSMTSRRFSVPNGGGIPYESDSTKIVVGTDGHIHFSEENGEGWIYFYPDQIPHLKKALAALRRQKSHQSDKERKHGRTRSD